MVNLLSNLSTKVPYEVSFTDYSHQKDKILHKYNLNDFVNTLEYGVNSEELLSIAEKVPYRVTQTPKTSVIEERFQFVKELVAKLEKNVAKRMEQEDEPFERVRRNI